MRKIGIFTIVAVLLGACASPPAPRPVPAPEPAAAPALQPEPQARPAQAPAARQRPPTVVRIDNASIEAFRSSWQRLRASLSPAQQAALNGAVATLAFAGYDSLPDLPGNLRDSPIVPEMIRHRIDGMTYSEIVALARVPSGP